MIYNPKGGDNLVEFREDGQGNLIGKDGKILVPKAKRQKTEVYSRVVGYLRPVSQWNKGKQREFANRKMFKAG